MPGKYIIDVRFRWWFAPLLKLLVRCALIKRGKFVEA